MPESKNTKNEDFKDATAATLRAIAGKWMRQSKMSCAG